MFDCPCTRPFRLEPCMCNDDSTTGHKRANGWREVLQVVHIVCRCRGILNGYPLYSFQRFKRFAQSAAIVVSLSLSHIHVYTYTQRDTLSCSAAIESRATCCWPIACNPACTRTWKNHVLKAATGTTSRRNSLADYRSIDRSIDDHVRRWWCPLNFLTE